MEVVVTMTCQEMVDELKAGELHQLGDLQESSYLAFINSGLRELHHRFDLKSDEYLLFVDPRVPNYTLPANVLKILAVYDNNGIPWAINQEGTEYGLMQPSYNSIRLLDPTKAEVLSIVYVAEATKMTSLTNDLDIPSQVIPTLMDYVTYKAFTNLSDDGNGKSSHYYKKYEQSCLDLTKYGLIIDDIEKADKFNMRGFI